MLETKTVQVLKNMMLELALPLDTTKPTPLLATMVTALAGLLLHLPCLGPRVPSP